MKHFITLCMALLCVTTAVSAFDRSSLDWNISASAVSYGSATLQETVKTICAEKFTHFVVSGAVGSSMKFDENLFGTVSFTPVADFYSSNAGDATILDWCANAGLRLYPGIGGLNLGVEYSLGTREDIINLVGEAATNTFTPAGNGFRFVAEYDFSAQISGFAPLVGLSWRHMPRGNNESDNIFSLYLSFQN